MKNEELRIENEETAWFLVLGSWFLVLGSWFLVLGSTSKALIPKHQAPSTSHHPILPRARIDAGSSVGLFSGWIPILADQFGSSAHPGANHSSPAFRWVRIKAGFHTGYFPSPIRAKTGLIRSKNRIPSPIYGDLYQAPNTKH